MKNYALVIGLAISLFTGFANADVVQIQYTDKVGTPTSKKGSPYYINPQSTFKVGFSAGVGRKIVAEVKDSKGVIVDTKTKSRVESTDTFIVDGVTYFGSEFDFNNLVDGKYTLTSIVYNSSQVEVSRQSNELVIDTATPQIVGDLYWNPFGQYVFKHTDGKFIVSRAGLQDAGYPSITVGASGFSHATFTSEYLDGPNAGTKHAVDAPVTLTSEGKLIIGNGTPNSVSSAYIPDNTSNQMRLTYRIFNKVGVSSTKSIDVYVATKTAPKPTPYGVYTGVSTRLNGVNAFTGFVPYVAKMTVPSNPVRMIYRASRTMYIGGGTSANIYGGWLNGTRGPNKVVHTDSQYIYFDVTGSTDGKQFSSVQLYTRDVSTWRTHLLEHDVKIPSGLEPPKVVNFNFYIQGLNEWVTSTGISTYYITKDQTGGANDAITKIKVVLEPRLYDQKYSFDFGYINSAYKGSCTVPTGQTECTIDTSLPYPADDLNNYHNRVSASNVAGTLLGTEIVPTWMYDGSIAEMDASSLTHDSINKTFNVAFINRFSDRGYGSSMIRVLDAFAVDGNGVKTKLSRTNYVTNAINSTTTYVTGTFTYAGLKDGIYSIEAYVEDGFNPIKSNKKTHTLFTNIAIDTTPPVIITNVKNQLVKSLSSIEITATDKSMVKLKSALLTGGVDGVNISLPTVAKGNNSFRPEHIYIKPSESDLYTMTIVVEDAFGNQATKVETFYYVPKVVALADIKQPAISAPLKSDNGLPSNVIRTPQLKNDAGELAVGNHEVIFTLLPTAQSSMVVNGKTVAPGESHEFTVNLSKTNHRLVFEAYPAVSGQEVSNKYEINVVDIKVSLCPDMFTLNSGQCIHLSFADPLLKCNTPYALVDGQCQLEVLYNPSTTCLSGYTLDGTTCRGSYTVNPLTMCPTGYSQVDESTCKEIKTFALKVCPDGETIEEGFCKDAKGNTSPQKQYCQGKDISGGSFCDAGTCYDYKKDWNACQITTTVPSTPVCQAGTLSSGACQVTDQYQLNMQCPFGYNRDGLLCKRIEIIAPNKSCPAGYDLAGNNCTKTEVSPYISCPSTHELMNGRCHKKEAIKINCPATFSWDGTQCVKNEQKPAVPLCPAGYTHNGTECQKVDVIDATIVCPANFYPENGRCTNKATNAASPVCPASYLWDATDKICKKQESQVASSICPAGYSLDGSICKMVENQSASGNCSASDIANGYMWDGSKCSKDIVKAATPNCASGYSWNGTTCSKSETQLATLNCPAGYLWNGTTCSKDESQAATPNCASGYTWNGSSCAKTNTTAATPNCASGYTWNGSTCAKTDTQSATLNCPAGYTWNGTTCTKNETQSATLNCPSGYTWNGSTCSKNESQAATPNCASGYTWNGSTCSKTNTTAATPNCASGYTWNGSTCSKNESQAATLNCPAGYTWNGTTCSKEETLTATRSCPAGYTWNGSTCSLTASTSATRTCPSGYTWNGTTCAKSESQAATPVCASGFTWNGTTCTKTESQLATMSCAPSQGWTAWDPRTDQAVFCEENLSAQGNLLGGNCYYGSKPVCEVQGTCQSQGIPTTNPCADGMMTGYDSATCPSGWTVNGSSCQRTVTQAPTYSCPSGWTVSGSSCNRTATATPSYSCSLGWTLSGSTCSTTVTAAPTYSCSSGWTLNGTNCNRTVTATQTYSCPSGWTVSGSNCNRTLTDAPTYSCSSGWTVSGSNCTQIQTQSPSYSCPSGWNLDGSNCNRTLTATESYSCSSGWTLSGSSCNRTLTAPQTYSCPSGWTVNGSNCNKTVTDTPTYTCASGWTVSGSNCTQVQTQPPTYSCPSGWTVNGSNCERTVTAAQSYSCSSGWTVSGSNCNRTLTDAPTYSCAAADGTVIGSNCVKTQTATTAYSCPVAGGWALSGSNCSRTLTQPVTYNCPSTGGWTLNNSMCERTLTESPSSYVCDPGQQLEGQTCNTFTYEDPDYYECPVSWSLDGKSCKLTTLSPVSGYECDQDWVLDGQTCRINRYEAETRTCSATQTKLDNTTCYENVPSTSVGDCPAGYVSNVTNCTKSLTEAVILSCNQNYDLIAQQCHTTLEQAVTVECQPGEELRSGKCVVIKKHIPRMACESPYQLDAIKCKNEITVPALN